MSVSLPCIGLEIGQLGSFVDMVGKSINLGTQYLEGYMWNFFTSLHERATCFLGTLKQRNAIFERFHAVIDIGNIMLIIKLMRCFKHDEC